MAAGMTNIQVVTGVRSARTWLLVAFVTVASAAAITAIDGGRAALPSSAMALVMSLPASALWLASAAGLGNFAARLLKVRGCATTIAIGVSCLLIAEQWCGTFGAFAGGPLAGLMLLAPGWWLLARHPLRGEVGTLPTWSALPIGLACGAILAAALMPAGFLFSTEFGGYDALSYHLQVPREWLETGSMRPLEHLAYAGLPNFIEGAYMHLMSLRSDPRDAAISCQLLHASIAVLASGVVAELLMQLGALQWARGCAVVVMLATPWVMVTGSLAYSEAGVLLGLSLAMAAVSPSSTWTRGVLFGLGVALMIGSKASSITLAAPAAIVWVVVLMPTRLDVRWWVCWIGVLGVALFPWLMRNTWFTTAAIFPLLAQTAGLGWWTVDQAARWDAAHRSHATVVERLRSLWQQWLIFGVGANPTEGEPWRWFWATLPWLGVASECILLSVRRWRRVAIALCAMTLATVIAWMFTTHLQSRFLIPTVVPLAIAVGLVIGMVAQSQPATRRLAMLICLCLGFISAWALVSDAAGKLALSGRVDVATGVLDLAMLASEDDALVAEVRGHPSAEAAITGLFPGQRILCVGFSAPFWLPPDVMMRWSTVWDRNVMQEALQQPDPIAWLRERFDLLLIDEPMLLRWQCSGWLAPELQPENLSQVFAGRDAMQLAGGKRLISLRDRLAPTWPERRRRDGVIRSY